MIYYEENIDTFLELGERLFRSPRSYKSAALPTELHQLYSKTTYIYRGETTPQMKAGNSRQSGRGMQGVAGVIWRVLGIIFLVWPMAAKDLPRNR